MIQLDKKQYDELCADLYPKFLEYVSQHGQSLQNAEVVSSLDTVTHVVGLKEVEGTVSVCLVPVNLLQPATPTE